MEILDTTPVMPGSVCRGDEIRQWLNYKGHSVVKFAILDDDNNMAEYTDKYLVQTDSEIGLQEKDALRCIELLS